MDSRRWIAFFIFTLGVVLLFNARIAQKQKLANEARRQAQASAQAELPTTSTLAAIQEPRPQTQPQRPSLRPSAEETELEAETVRMDRETAPTVEIRTRAHHVVFSTLGAVPLQWELIHLTGATSPKGDTSSTTTVNLIPETYSSQREYPFTIEGRPLDLFNEVPFQVRKTQLPDGGVELTMTSEDRRGLQVVKRFGFPADGYLVSFSLTILNGTDLRKLFSDNDMGFGIGWQGGFMQPQEDSRVAGYLAALAANDAGLHAEHLKPKGEPVTYKGPIHWAGLERKFFLASLIPAKGNPAASALMIVRERDMGPAYQPKGIAPPVSVVLQQDRFELEPGQSATFSYTLFAGPKNHAILKAADRTLGLTDQTGLATTVFHGTLGIIRWLSLLLLALLKWFHGLTLSYGYSIILLTILVRVVTYPLTHKSMKIQAKTMAQQARLKPFIDEINKKYKDDPAKRNQAMMKLWKEHGVNPFGMLRGCVPVLLQMPIFIALYYLLDQAIELRGQSFYWITDLSMPDRLLAFPGFSLPLIGVINSLNILPVLMGVTQVVASRMSMSAAADPTQRQMMIIMPLAFVFFLYNFPSGLMLYWVVTNIWQIGQQKLTNRLIQREQSTPQAPARG